MSYDQNLDLTDFLAVEDYAFAVGGHPETEFGVDITDVRYEITPLPPTEGNPVPVPDSDLPPNLQLTCCSCNFFCFDALTFRCHVSLHYYDPKLDRYSCNVCKFHSEERLDVVAHTQINHQEGFALRCSVHKEVQTSTQDELLQHFTKVHKSPPVSLTYNPETADRKSDPFHCDYCEFTTQTDFRLTAHIQIFHVDQYLLQCRLCSFSSKRKPNLLQHIRDELKSYKHTCWSCNYETNSIEKFESHSSKSCKGKKGSKRDQEYLTASEKAAKKKAEELKQFRCPDNVFECKFQGNNMKELDQHLSESHPRSYVCPVCHFRTFMKRDLANHKMKQPKKVRKKGTRKRAMPYNPAVFSAPRGRPRLNKEQVTIITEPEEKLTLSDIKENFLRIGCPFCEDAFFTKSEIADHLEQSCEGAEPEEHVKCPVCPFTGQAKKLMRLHMQRHVVQENRKALSTLGSGQKRRTGPTKVRVKKVVLTTEEDLEEDEAMEEAQFRCKDYNYGCKFEGSSAADLKSHVDEDHTLMYMCSECSYTSTLRSILVQHRHLKTRPLIALGYEEEKPLSRLRERKPRRRFDDYESDEEGEEIVSSEDDGEEGEGVEEKLDEMALMMTDATSDRLVCPFCDEGCMGGRKWFEHMEEMCNGHSSNELMDCPYKKCSYSVQNKMRMTYHAKGHLLKAIRDKLIQKKRRIQ